MKMQMLRATATLFLLVCASTSAISKAHAACAVIVYRDANFSGEAELIRGDQAFVGQHWNDQISSIRVLAGRWDFYWDANYGGEVLSYGPGNYSFVGPHWNDEISSLRCVGGGYEGELRGYNLGGGRRHGYTVVERGRVGGLGRGAARGARRGERNGRDHGSGGDRRREGGHHEGGGVGGHHGGGGHQGGGVGGHQGGGGHGGGARRR